MKQFRFFLYGLALAYVLFSFPVQAKFTCGKTQNFVLQSLVDGYALLSTGINSKTTAIIVMLDREGNFKIIGTDENDQACVLMQGTDWTFFLEETA